MEMSGISYENKNVTPQNTSNYDENIYDDIEDYQESQRTTNHPGTSQNPGPDSAGRCYKVTGVVLLLLCGLLLSVVTALWIMYNNQTTEKNQLQTSNSNLTAERNQLKTSYNNLTAERNQLQTSYDTIRNQKEQEKVVRQKLLMSLVTDMQNVNWTFFDTSIYYINTQDLTWNESRQACRDRGADLVIVNNQEEQDFIRNWKSERLVWIGLSDIDTEGQWKWVDGSLLTIGILSFRTWEVGQPDGGVKQNCVYFRLNWRDYECDSRLQSICETKI